MNRNVASSLATGPTFMPEPLDLTCILLALAIPWISGVQEIVTTRIKLKTPAATLSMLALVMAMFPILHAEPGLLPILARNSSLLEHGELWRAFTALFAQETGTAGAIFNMAILLVVGAVAEQLLGWRPWLAVYLGAGILTEFLGLAWQPNGSGNSIAVFGLAGALAVRSGQVPSTFQSMLRIVGISAGAGLLMSHDIHGIGFWTGALIAAVLAAQVSAAQRLGARTNREAAE